MLPNVVLHPDIFIEAELLFVTRALISDLQPVAVGIQVDAVICDGSTRTAALLFTSGEADGCQSEGAENGLFHEAVWLGEGL